MLLAHAGALVLRQAQDDWSSGLELRPKSLRMSMHNSLARRWIPDQVREDEQKRIWIILNGDCHIFGRREAVRREMWRFLRVLLPGSE